MTWSSPSPAVSRSRTRMRKSRASGASESSIDWFWHTMQRRSRDSVRARVSSAASDRISSGWTARAGVEARPHPIRNAANKRRVREYAILSFRRLERGAGFGGLRRADAQAAVGERERAAQNHHQRAEPDQQHQRLVIEPDRDRAVRVLVAEREIDLAQAARHQGRLGGRGAADREAAL